MEIGRRLWDATRRDSLAQDMIELLRTNDPVLLSFAEAVLASENVAFLVTDRHMSVLEGSLGFIRRRVLVADHDNERARGALEEAGLGGELSPS